ncbi:hypothetical protein D918_05870 [Trichuris suis]|nr:hypothetical protein D918_05870 [Trichuris suis]
MKLWMIQALVMLRYKVSVDFKELWKTMQSSKTAAILAFRFLKTSLRCKPFPKTAVLNPNRLLIGPLAQYGASKSPEVTSGSLSSLCKFTQACLADQF